MPETNRVHSSSRRYRVLVASILCFVGIYSGAVLLLPRLGFTEETYLLYSWFVFPHVPSREEITYEAYITAIQGVSIPRERLESSDAFLHNDMHTVPDYRRRIRRIGELLSQNAHEEASAQRREIESLAHTRPLTYEIVSITYNPIAKFREGSVLATSSLGVYTAP